MTLLKNKSYCFTINFVPCQKHMAYFRIQIYRNIKVTNCCFQTSILLAQGQLPVDRCSDTIKSILAETTSRHISVSGILERSGSFTKPESLTRNIMGTSSDMMVDFVFIEEVQNALEKLTLRVNHGKRCSQQILICFKIANVNINLFKSSNV